MTYDARSLALRLRPWLILGRVSNLPTVWSNCLAAWLLGGGGAAWRLWLLVAGASAVYLGGMLLNDAADVEFDRQHRAERPIPRGDVQTKDVWLGGVLALAIGIASLGVLGTMTLYLALLLAGSVLVYDLTHKRVPAWAPALMGLCRYFLFLTAGSVARAGVTGEIAWSALALGAYVAGVSGLARQEATSPQPAAVAWPLACLAVPVVLAALVNPVSTWFDGRVAAPVAWWALLVVWALSHLYRPDPGKGRIGPAVGGLLAGIVAVDAMAVMATPWPWAAVFVGLWALARGLQRVVPAT